METTNAKPAVRVTNETIFASLSYMWVLCLVPALLKKDQPFVRFHARQGLMLFIIEVALGIIGIVPFLGLAIARIGLLVCSVISIIGIVQVVRGKEWKIPFVNEWAEKIIKI